MTAYLHGVKKYSTKLALINNKKKPVSIITSRINIFVIVFRVSLQNG